MYRVAKGRARAASTSRKQHLFCGKRLLELSSTITSIDLLRSNTEPKMRSGVFILFVPKAAMIQIPVLIFDKTFDESQKALAEFNLSATVTPNFESKSNSSRLLELLLYSDGDKLNCFDTVVIRIQTHGQNFNLAVSLPDVHVKRIVKSTLLFNTMVHSYLTSKQCEDRKGRCIAYLELWNEEKYPEVDFFDSMVRCMQDCNSPTSSLSASSSPSPSPSPPPPTPLSLSATHKNRRQILSRKERKLRAKTAKARAKRNGDLIPKRRRRRRDVKSNGSGSGAETDLEVEIEVDAKVDAVAVTINGLAITSSATTTATTALSENALAATTTTTTTTTTPSDSSVDSIYIDASEIEADTVDTAHTLSDVSDIPSSEEADISEETKDLFDANLIAKPLEISALSLSSPSSSSSSSSLSSSSLISLPPSPISSISTMSIPATPPPSVKFPTYLPSSSPAPTSTYSNSFSREYQTNLSTLDHLVRITHILDLDGFVLKDGFVCQEMALIDIGGLGLQCEHFKLGRSYEQLDSQDLASVRFVTRSIHGMPFMDHPQDHLCQTDVPATLTAMLSRSGFAREDTVIGYTGGFLELCLLNHLGLKSVDISELGCPRFDDFFEKPEHQTLLLEAKPVLYNLHCDRHIYIDRALRYKLHCCRQEVFMFRHWYLRKYLRL